MWEWILRENSMLRFSQEATQKVYRASTLSEMVCVSFE
jgi:hypothetical protein